MKILICASEYPPYTSGAGNVAYNTIKHFEKHGHECIVCSPIGPDIKICDEKIIKRIFNFRPLCYLYTVIYFWFKTKKYVERNLKNYDALLLHNINPIFSWDIHSVNTKILFIFHTTYFGYYDKLSLHGMYKLYYNFMARLEQKRLAKINKKAIFIGVNQATCDELFSQGIDKIKIKCISNGVDIEKFKPSPLKAKIRRKLGLPQDQILFLSVGRITEQKDLFKMIEVFKNIQKLNSNVLLVIVGGGELLRDLQQYAKNNGIKNVKFEGYVNDEYLPLFYASSDYFIISSKYEGQPLTLLEAIASGLPCIVSKIPNLSVVKVANCGIIVNFDNCEGASNDILQYIMTDLPSIHSKNGRNYAEKNLNWELVAKNYLKNLSTLEGNNA
jgi:1,2-diacylglycerol 3-alpha-glucosyltransferase